MRVKQPAQLNMRSILDASFTAQEEVPDLWSLWLTQALATPSDWHTAQPKGRYLFHASSLSNCDRAEWYKRHEYARDPEPMESKATLTVGQFWHAIIQFGLAVHPEYTLIGHEIGGWSTTSPLAGLVDAVFEFDGRIIQLEIKSEKQMAAKIRREAAQREGRTDTGKDDHKSQVDAGTILLLELHNIDVNERWLLYICKNDENLDAQPVPFDGERGFNLGRRLGNLDRLTAQNEPPERLDLNDRSIAWRCQQYNRENRGRWCPYWSTCRGHA